MYHRNAQRGIPGRLCGGRTIICLPVIHVIIFLTFETGSPIGNVLFRGISMGTLADQIDVSRNTLSRIVTGITADPASSIIVKIAKELRVSTDYLYSLTQVATY